MRLNWSSTRHGPDEFDNSAPEVESLEFDYTHQGGAAPWPAKFGPATIGKAWRAGLVVYAEILDWPHPVAVKKAQWTAGCLEVLTTAGPRIPKRIFTRSTVRGLQSTGELIE